MKRCPECYLTFSDNNSFCLLDGTPLLELVDDPELATVVRPPASEPTSTFRLPKGLVIGLSAIGTLLLLFVGLLAYFFVSGPGNAERSTEVNADPPGNQSTGTPEPARNVDRARSDRTLEDVQVEREIVERERQKLAEARKRLDEEKRVANLPAPSTASTADQQTVRIKFRPGRVEDTVSGTVGLRRRFVLYTLRGQDLAARVRSDNDCVVFDTGSAEFNSPTKAGDMYLNLKNNCGGTVKFSLNVHVR
jgi:hypothetical protein